MSTATPAAPSRPSLVTTVPVDGSGVRVWTYPATDGPAEGVVLAVHGFRGDRHGLAQLVGALPRHTVVVPDLPGFGASAPFADLPHDAASYGRVVGALRDALGIGPDAVLLGHSYGSIVAARYAAAHPGHFAALVLVNPICDPALEGPQRTLSLLAGAYYALGRALPERAGLALLRSRLVTDAMSAAMGTSKDPAMRAHVRAQHRRYFGGFASRASLAETFACSVTSTVRQVAPAVACPTLLVVGERDALGPVEDQRTLADAFPDAELAVVPGVGHLIHYEAPATAAGHIVRFLAG